MIDKIKSAYSLDIIFSYFNENKKLNILMYNKKLLLKLHLNIQNYKNFSGIKIVNKNRRKEYLNGQLIYDGEYKNNKRDGKGKEYYNGIIIYDGEYKNDKKHGKGKEFYENGELYFEGMYCFGEKGKGNFYKNRKKKLIKVYLKSISGKCFEFEVNCDDTILDLKYLYQEKEGKPPSEIFLIFRNKRLIDDRFIFDYHIKNGSKIDVILSYSTNGG